MQLGLIHEYNAIVHQLICMYVCKHASVDKHTIVHQLICMFVGAAGCIFNGLCQDMAVQAVAQCNVANFGSLMSHQAWLLRSLLFGSLGPMWVRVAQAIL